MDQPPVLPPASFPPPGGGMPPPVVQRRPLSFWLALLFAGSTGVMGLALLGMAAGMGSLAPRTDHNLLEHEIEGSGRDKIAWIPIHGILMHSEEGPFSSGDMVKQAIEAIETAAADDQVKAVVLAVDTPGGGVTESDEIHHALKTLRSVDKEKDKKLVVLMGGVAASGGYYISAAADRILAQPTTITGSIGVIMEGYNLEGLLDKVGVRTEVFKSGRFKDMGSPTRPMNEGDRRLFHRLVSDMYEKFVDIVLDGRKRVTLPDKSPFDEDHLRRIADGRIYTADDALDVGLIDAIGYREDALKAARELAGISEARVVEYARRPPNLFELIGARTQPPGIQIQLDPKTLLRAASPRLLYLWTVP